MNNLPNTTTIKEILGCYGFHFSKVLGQNFLISPTVCLRVVEQSGAAPETGVLEVGPDIGVLMCELVERVQKVVSTKLDHRLLPALKGTPADYDDVTIVNGNILKLDLKKSFQCKFTGMPVSVRTSLPYHIASPVTMRLLEGRLDITSLIVIMQKEAARYICV